MAIWDLAHRAAAVLALSGLCSGLTNGNMDLYYKHDVAGFSDPEQFRFEWKAVAFDTLPKELRNEWGNDSDATETRIALQVRLTVKTSGWLALGICEQGSGGMAGTDMAVAHVDTNGVGHVRDYYATGTFQPLLDKNQDWRVLTATESNGVTTVELVRLQETADVSAGSFDRPFALNPRHATRFAFAYGDRDPNADGTFSIHREMVNFVVYLGRDPNDSVKAELERGAVDTYVLSTASPYQTHRGRMMREEVTKGMIGPLEVSPDEFGGFLNSGKDALERDPDARGAYYNIYFRIPGLAGRVLTGFTALLTEENRPYLHHFVLMDVKCPPKDLEEPGYSSMQMATLAEWVPGIDEQLFVTDEGAASGFVFDDNCLMLNIHYDYLPKDRTIKDYSWMKIYVSDTRPAMERGNLEVADGLVNTETVVKAGQYSRFVYDCPARFTSYVVPEDGVKVDAAVLHMHGTGQYVETSFSRKGVIYKRLTIEYFNIDQQQRLTFEPFELRKGDVITTTCIYKPQGKSDVTFGLYSDNEMCITWLEHYPALKYVVPADLFDMSMMPGSPALDLPIPTKCVYVPPYTGNPNDLPKLNKFFVDMAGTFRGQASQAAPKRRFEGMAAGSGVRAGRVVETLVSLLGTLTVAAAALY